MWEIIYMSIILLGMFIALLSDRIGADMVMLTALTFCLVSNIITLEEGLIGFSNPGLLTVLVLVVVASGIERTGALDWYMRKLLGNPASVAGAQLRLVLPIATVSAFLNNTPVVAIMIPIVQRWGENIGVNPQKLLIPLSFASILGGTCTLIGTSTNLVVAGLLADQYDDSLTETSYEIGLFELGLYGVPVAFVGISYILVATPWLLSSSKSTSFAQSAASENILLGARLTRWSRAAGRTVKRSGLRDTGGIYLVSVLRAETGNIHRAVGQDFVLNKGDILYFTGFIEEFGDFCEEHGLEVITTEEIQAEKETNYINESAKVITGSSSNIPLSPVLEDFSSGDNIELDEHESSLMDKGALIGISKESLMMCDEAAKHRGINKITDLIRGVYDPSSEEEFFGITRKRSKSKRRYRKKQHSFSSSLGDKDPANIIVYIDINQSSEESQMIVVGVNSKDRPGLLLDISKTLLKLGLTLRHNEASVIGRRSLSIWRCELINDKHIDTEEVWSLLHDLLADESGVQAVKDKGLNVLRAVVMKDSSLVGKNPQDVDFRKSYRAALITCQRNGKNVSLTKSNISSFRFQAGDLLVLQVMEDSPLLLEPPSEFFEKFSSTKATNIGSRLRHSLSKGEIAGMFKSGSKGSLAEFTAASSSLQGKHVEDSGETRGHQSEVLEYGYHCNTEEEPAKIKGSGKEAPLPSDSSCVQNEMVWNDLNVLFNEGNSSNVKGSSEFLTAMQIIPRSRLANKSVIESGLDKLTGVFLVDIERPTLPNQSLPYVNNSITKYDSMAPSDKLLPGDILWYAGDAMNIGNLRKVPGMKPYDDVDDQIKQLETDSHERRLVQAVVARQGPLVGKTVKEVRFRTRYGAAAIAVQRNGKRVQDHPGNIKVQGGDVLLLEAGPSFIAKKANADKSFALLSEVKDSTPPRLKLLIPALLLTITALAFYTAGVTSLLVSSLFASIIMVCIGVLTQQEARDAVNWDVYLTIACAFGIGKALVKSGLAEIISDVLVNIGSGIGIGNAGLLGSVYFATFLVSNVVTNNAAAALVFPIAIEAAEVSGINVMKMSYAVMLGASASFLTPFGYTTNLLIYGPGGYSTFDFIKIGAPMQMILWLFTTAILSLDDSQWYIGWISSVLCFSIAVIVTVPVCRFSK